MADDQGTMPAGRSGRKKNVVVGVAIFSIMLLEGGGLYLAMKLFGSPQSVDAASVGGTTDRDEEEYYREFVELEVADIKAPWVKTGRTFVFEMSVAVRLRPETEAATEKIFKENKALIADRLTRVIRSAEPNHLEEDGLETIRRQIKHELDVVLGDEKIIREVLIPRFIKFRADY